MPPGIQRLIDWLTDILGQLWGRVMGGQMPALMALIAILLCGASRPELHDSAITVECIELNIVITDVHGSRDHQWLLWDRCGGCNDLVPIWCGWWDRQPLIHWRPGTFELDLQIEGIATRISSPRACYAWSRSKEERWHWPCRCDEEGP